MKPPTEPGYYWFRFFQTAEWTVMHVFEKDGELLTEHIAKEPSRIIMSMRMRKEYNPTAQWGDRLQKPVE